MSAVPAGARPADSQAAAGPALALAPVLSGASLSHTLPSGAKEALSQPDDLAALAGQLFVVFQNNVGADGSPSPSGNLASTVVEFTPAGDVVRQWDVTGHADGLVADPSRGQVIVTVNEDGNSSLYTIAPSAPAGAQIKAYTYQPNVLPHGGGTDAVSIFDGRLLVSALAPTVPDGPAVYVAALVGGTAVLRPLFADNASATVANAGSGWQQTTLALTDPDSNEVVPGQAQRFQGDFVLDSQGDQQQIYLQDLGQGGGSALQVLNLSQSINATAWVTARRGTLYVTDKSSGDVVAVRGPFDDGTAYVAVTPCSANSAPNTCPAPGFPANYLGTLDMFTGAVQQVTLPAGTALQPQGLLFVGADGGEDPGAQGNEG